MAGGCGTRCWRPEPSSASSTWLMACSVQICSATAPVDHQEHSLQQPADLVAELGAELDQLTLVQSCGAEAPLNVCLVVVRLRLGNAPQVVGVHGQQPEGSVVSCSRATEQPRHLQHGRVVFTSPVTGFGRGEAERLVERPQQAHSHPVVDGKLLVGTV